MRGRSAIRGAWMRLTSKSEAGGSTCIAPWIKYPRINILQHWHFNEALHGGRPIVLYFPFRQTTPKWIRGEAKSFEWNSFQFNRERRQFLERGGVQNTDSEPDGLLRSF